MHVTQLQYHAVQVSILIEHFGVNIGRELQETKRIVRSRVAGCTQKDNVGWYLFQLADLQGKVANLLIILVFEHPLGLLCICFISALIKSSSRCQQQRCLRA